MNTGLRLLVVFLAIPLGGFVLALFGPIVFLFGFLPVMLLLGGAWGYVRSQDERIADLEARVAELEARNDAGDADGEPPDGTAE
ncbi:bZIP transcription factor [Halostella salina]|uniref:bZIP transcription factor n=1 Tax=Halostella salina TaxID=1547897 RepID=UPI000EF77056|nr:bZIP transcription factor [Halostella salina]